MKTVYSYLLSYFRYFTFMYGMKQQRHEGRHLFLSSRKIDLSTLNKPIHSVDNYRFSSLLSLRQTPAGSNLITGVLLDKNYNFY